MSRNSILSNVIGRCLAGVVLLSGCASATTIIATGVDNNRGGSLWMNENGTDTQAMFAGVILIAVRQNNVTYNRDALCVDLFTNINLNQTYNTTILSPSDVSGKNLQRVSWLVDNALLPANGFKPGYPSSLPSSDWVLTAAQGEGIQLAIWDIVHDNGDGFSAGSVQKSKSASNPTNVTALNWAQFYETASLNQHSNYAFIYQNVTLSGQPAQMLAGPQYLDGGPDPPNFNPETPLPEPSTMALAGSALILIGKFLRRRKQ